jgi:molecular chaperone GrpE
VIDPTPEDPLAVAIAERDDYLDQLQRSRAEFVNFRRRSDQERAQLRDFVARDISSQFIPVIDDFERAMTMAPADPEVAKFVQGIEMIQSRLKAVFDRLGVTRIEAVGQPFDPALHEAVASEPGTSGSTVVEVYQNGYRIGDTLVRPAMVKTGDAAPESSPDSASFSA